jgi:hypothetical protein
MTTRPPIGALFDQRTGAYDEAAWRLEFAQEPVAFVDLDWAAVVRDLATLSGMPAWRVDMAST